MQCAILLPVCNAADSHGYKNVLAASGPRGRQYSPMRLSSPQAIAEVAIQYPIDAGELQQTGRRASSSGSVIEFDTANGGRSSLLHRRPSRNGRA
jgi:hypothetical protein